MLDISDLPSRHNCILALWQRDIERILAAWVAELGVPTLHGQDLVGFEQDPTGVDVELSDHTALRAQFLVGCDGGRSLVRKLAGIEFPGWDATTSFMIAEVEMRDQPPIGMRPEGGGIGPVNRGDETGGPYRVVLLEDQLEHANAPTLDDLRDALRAAFGTDFGVHNPTWISRFSDICRQAASYREGRVLLAGDAAHVHGPQGGQGLNVGVQDAVNLGWKLARVVKGISPDSLLDSYHAERHPVAARVLQNTMAQVALARTDERSQALRRTVLELLGLAEPRQRIAAMISGLDVCYATELGDAAHPLAGRRMPDLEVRTDSGRIRVAEMLRAARPVLLSLTASTRFDLPAWVSGITTLGGDYDGPLELPVLGAVQVPEAVLIRPDGYVAWAGTLDEPALAQVISVWFAAPDYESGTTT
jgi:3-(3-hydroxy-phenyl)propionate hydroxylase